MVEDTTVLKSHCNIQVEMSSRPLDESERVVRNGVKDWEDTSIEVKAKL